MPEYHWTTPQEWYASLDDDTRKIADEKIRILEQFHANDPLSWVSSELRQGIPQVARFLFLHQVRTQVLDGYLPFSMPDNAWFERSLSPLERMKLGEEAFDRLLASGASREDLVRIARAAACTAAYDFVEMLDGVSDSDDDEAANAPTWALMELIEKDGKQKLTGRVLNGLHESLSDLYPEDN